MTTIAQARVEKAARIEKEAAEAARRAEAEKIERESIVASLATTNELMKNQIGQQMKAVGCLMCAIEVLSSAVQSIEEVENDELSLQELQTLRSSVMMKNFEFLNVLNDLSTGDVDKYENYVEDSITDDLSEEVTGGCGNAECPVCGEGGIAVGVEAGTFEEAGISPEAFGAALQDALEKGLLSTEDGAMGELEVNGVKVQLQSLGRASSREEANAIIEKRLATIN